MRQRGGLPPRTPLKVSVDILQNRQLENDRPFRHLIKHPRLICLFYHCKFSTFLIAAKSYIFNRQVVICMENPRRFSGLEVKLPLDEWREVVIRGAAGSTPVDVYLMLYYKLNIVILSNENGKIVRREEPTREYGDPRYDDDMDPSKLVY